MPSLNPPLTKDDFNNSGWQDAIDSSERKECLAYSTAFWKKAQEAKEAGNVREQTVFEILAAVTGAAIKPSNEEFFAEIFQNFTDEYLDFLAKIAPDISDPELQARITDILWVRQPVAHQIKHQVEQSDPWGKFAGMFKDDPLFDDFVDDIATYRRELDAVVGANEVPLGENQSA